MSRHPLNVAADASLHITRRRGGREIRMPGAGSGRPELEPPAQAGHRLDRQGRRVVPLQEAPALAEAGREPLASQEPRVPLRDDD